MFIKESIQKTKVNFNCLMRNLQNMNAFEAHRISIVDQNFTLCFAVQFINSFECYLEVLVKICSSGMKFGIFTRNIPATE